MKNHIRKLSQKSINLLNKTKAYPDEKYGFLIDEFGNIYKCPMGILNYAIIDDYLEGGFSTRFKEFNKNFYKAFISSCPSCYRFFSGHRRTVTDVCKSTI